MPRVLVCNNYPLDRVWEEVKLRETPDHGLFGINFFQQRGYQVEVMPVWRKDIGYHLNRLLGMIRFPVPLGDLSQEIAILKKINSADLIYAPCAEVTQMIQYLRGIGLIGKPLVCLMHHPFLKGRLDFIRKPFRHLFMAGADAIPTLSTAVSEDLNASFKAGGKAFPMSWGPDLQFYSECKTAGRGVVAAGRTGRDFMTFGHAASQAKSPVSIICLEGQFPGAMPSLGNNVRVLVQSSQQPVPGKKIGWMKYPELLEHLTRARAIAIPLYAQDSLAGLTSLMDALGLGKPVIMTRNRHIDLDIEGEGIGFWVNPNDVDGWRSAIQWFETHEGEAYEMGRRARRLAEERCNSELFAGKMMDVFDQLLGRANSSNPMPQVLA